MFFFNTTPNNNISSKISQASHFLESMFIVDSLENKIRAEAVGRLAVKDGTATKMTARSAQCTPL